MQINKSTKKVIKYKYGTELQSYNLYDRGSYRRNLLLQRNGYFDDFRIQKRFNDFMIGVVSEKIEGKWNNICCINK